MLDLKQTDRMLRKLERFVDIIEPMIFEKVGEPGPVSAFATLERFHCIPEDSLFDPIEKGYNGARSSVIAGSRPILSSPTDSAEKIFSSARISQAMREPSGLTECPTATSARR